MSNYYNKKVTSNDLIGQMLQTGKKTKKTIEQQDNESLNTMEYYKEDNSSKNQRLEENNFMPKKILEKMQKINSKKGNEKSNLPFTLSQSYAGQSLYELYEKSSLGRTSSFFEKKKEKNVQNGNEDKKKDNDYCSKCNLEIEYPTKLCPHCINPLCRKCFKELFNRNLDNNNDNDNFEQNLINEKMCPNCGNLISLKDFVVQRPKRKNHTSRLLTEPLDTFKEDIYLTITNENKQKTVLMKDFDELNNKYDLLFKKIEENKKELEVKKEINLNTLEILKKSIEYEYNINFKKLNEISLKLKQIQNTMINKKNIIDKQNNFDNVIDLQNILEKFRNSENILSKKYVSLNQKLMIKQKPKAYKFYESNLLSIKFSDTYSMKNKEILSNNRIGKSYFKIERFVNSYVNCLNFSVSIHQDSKNSQNSIKSKIIVYMMINNKLFKLNKTNKNNNQLYSNYECSLEENKVFTSKSKSNNNIEKKDMVDIKFAITELFL